MDVATVKPFCQSERLMVYPGALLSPLTVVKGCSLLSAAFAHEVLLDCEVIQVLNNAVLMLMPKTALSTRPTLRKGDLFSADRLSWRATYLQAFELHVEFEVYPDSNLLLVGRQVTTVSDSDSDLSQ